VRNGPPQPAPQPVEESEGEAWENLTPDTDNVTAADTGPGPTKRSSATVRRTMPAVRMRPWWEMVLVGLMIAGGVLAAVVALVVWLFSGRGSGGSSAVPAENQPVRVSRAGGGPGTYRDVTAALSKVKEGGRIILQDATLDEDLNLHRQTCPKNVTIEGEEGKKVVIQGAKDGDASSPLIRVDTVEGLHLRNLSLDGGGRREKLVLLTGECPGATLEDLDLRGFTRCGVLVMNCKGAAPRPVTFRKLQLHADKETEAGLLFEVNPKMLIKINEFFLIRECHFEGPFKARVQKDDKVTHHLDEI
jgi:hypothetical protein